MGYLAVIVAAAAAWIYGAVHYTVLSKPWIRAVGVPLDDKGRPMGNGSMLPFLLSAICMLLVAGMMRHVFSMAAIDGIGKGLIGGLGIGAFFIAPWTMINNAYGQRPAMLTVIDGAYAIIGCGLIGAVLGWF